MTALNLGDRVRATIEGVVEYVSDNTVAIDYKSSDGWRVLTYVSRDLVETVGAPVKVGDTLTADSPEPPLNTVILDSRHRPWTRGHDRWLHHYAVPRINVNELARLNGPALTVVYVPETETTP